jgi:hypothetical protein
MAALVLRVADLSRTEAALAAGGIAGIVAEPGRLVVPADQAMGVTLAFSAA